MSDSSWHQALLRRLWRSTTANGHIQLPAVPALLDDYVDLCRRTFEAIGVTLSAEQSQHLRKVLAEQLDLAFQASSRSEIVITYEAPYGTTLNYHVRPQSVALDQVYNTWVGKREPPYFGVAPDARVWALARAAGDPSTCPVLDLGAGTGRNALPLARRGHPVDAVELSAEFAERLRREAIAETLPVRVFQRDLFTSPENLRCDYGLIVLSEVTSDFRHVQQLRQCFELAVNALAPGGCLVFNIFLPVLGYTPDAAARQLGQQVYTTLFTYPELAIALDGLPLVLVSDHSVHDYEQQHLPEGAWPPTAWYAGWVSGLDVFDTTRACSPIEMRWLVYRRL